MLQYIQTGRFLVGTAVLAIVGLGSAALWQPTTDMRIEPEQGPYTLEETFTVDIAVTAREPVNVFAGELQFEADKLAVAAIDYNTSIANLWAERPWYENGAGTLNFIGGTTQTGGFSGTGSLITVTFRPLATGEINLSLDDVRILRHDGLGSDTRVAEPIDTLITIGNPDLEHQTTRGTNNRPTVLRVQTALTRTDLNQDGQQTLADTSIFMRHLITQNSRSDFNEDGVVNNADLSILLGAD